VSAEVALALTLLGGAGLLTRSLVRLTHVNAGFDAAGLLTVEIQAAGARYGDDAAVNAHHDAVRAAVAAIPGVTGVGVTSQLPLGGNVDQYGVRAQDRPLSNPELAPGSDRYAVSPDFLRTMRIPLARGRAFVDADDRAEAPPVVIVSEALASHMWPGEDAIGKRVQMGDTTRPWRTVVGVAANVRHSGLDATVTQQVYVPSRQWYFADNQVTLVVRTTGDPTAIAAAVRNAIRSIDPSQPIGRLTTMREVVAATTAQRRLVQTLFLAVSAIALVLAAAGIYGVLAGHVAERTREIGLRRALGAMPAAVIRSVVLQGARLAGPGLVVGLAGAVALGRVLRGLLFGVTSTDPVTLGAVAVVLAVIALVACLAPAMRAVAIGPMSALRDAG
jgi:putative ABC transport system permease protein